MDRARLPSPLGYAHLIARCAALLSVHATLTIALYLSIFYSHTNPILYAVLLWVAIADNAEILALITNPRDAIGRAAAGLLLLWEAVGLVMFLVAYLVTYGAEGASGGPSIEQGMEWNEEQDEDLGKMSLYLRRLWQVVLLAVVLRAVLVVLCTIDAGRWRARAQNRQRVGLSLLDSI